MNGNVYDGDADKVFALVVLRVGRGLFPKIKGNQTPFDNLGSRLPSSGISASSSVWIICASRVYF